MQTFPVHYTDKIWGFQGRAVKVCARAEFKALSGQNRVIEESDFRSRCIIIKLKRRQFKRPNCGSDKVSTYSRRKIKTI